MKEIFAYGSLKQGGKWHHLIENELFKGTDTIEGEMYLEASGYYPILFAGVDLVQGEVWSLSDESYQKVWELEADADYEVKTVTTVGGLPVIVFFMKDESQKDPSRRINNFDAALYFNKWLAENDTDSPSYRQFLDWGG